MEELRCHRRGGLRRGVGRGAAIGGGPQGDALLGTGHTRDDGGGLSAGEAVGGPEGEAGVGAGEDPFGIQAENGVGGVIPAFTSGTDALTCARLLRSGMLRPSVVAAKMRAISARVTGRS